MNPLHRPVLVGLLATAAAAQSPFVVSRAPSMPTLVTGADLAAGDVDGDGDVDLVVANNQNPNRLWRNDGRGHFVDATAGRLVTPSVPPPGAFLANSTNEVDLADIDGDGDLDLLMVNDWDLPDRVYTNDGLGWFTDVTTTAVQDTPAWGTDQVVADFDGDGDVDWLVIHSSSLSLLLNDGTGVFTAAPAGSTPAGILTDHASSFAVDLDLDGDRDVVLPFVNSTIPPNAFLPRLLVNQGNATFTLAPANTIPFQGTVHAADVDGDGLPDLLAQNGRQLLRNLGGLSFAPPVLLPGASLTSFDRDLDGDLDLLGPDLLLVNDGTGAFTAVPSGVTLDNVLGSTCVADFDGDGDLDVAEAWTAWTTGYPSVRSNNFNQLSTKQDPTRGLPYTIEMVSPVRTTPVLWGTAVANGPGLLQLPGLAGVLRLDPNSAVPLWPMLLTTGLDTITWTIPNQPALVGTELHYQAAVLDPLRPAFLGNAVRDVIQ